MFGAGLRSGRVPVDGFTRSHGVKLKKYELGVSQVPRVTLAASPVCTKASFQSSCGSRKLIKLKKLTPDAGNCIIFILTNAETEN
jgi:hypothetical protein